MCNNKQISKVIKEAKKRGWYLHRSRKHDIYKHVNTGALVTVSSTTNNHNAWKRIECDFRRGE